MTAFTDTKSVEARKAIYSQELAAYTRRQWDMVCQAMEDGSRTQAAGQPSQQQESENVSPDSGTSSRHRHGIRARDYAQSTHKHINGQRNMATGEA